MKIGVISDIHANRAALGAVLDALRGVDVIICAGDLTGYYDDPDGVISDLLNHGVQFIIGNHDWYLDNAYSMSDLLRESVQFTQSRLRPEYRQLLAGTAGELHTRFGDLQLAMYHGSPWDPLHGYVYPDYPHFKRFAEIDADVIVLGHTHYPMVKRFRNRVVMNPGSCGQPRDRDVRASCAVIHTQSLSVDIVRAAYDSRNASPITIGNEWPIAASRMSRNGGMPK